MKNVVIVGFCKECAKCGCRFADFHSPIPPMHISEIPVSQRMTMENQGESYMKMIKEQNRYGYCNDCR